MQAAFEEQAKASEAAAQRQLAFIDRLLADKESLAQQCVQQAQQLKVHPCIHVLCLKTETNTALQAHDIIRAIVKGAVGCDLAGRGITAVHR